MIHLRYFLLGLSAVGMCILLAGCNNDDGVIVAKDVSFNDGYKMIDLLNNNKIGSETMEAGAGLIVSVKKEDKLKAINVLNNKGYYNTESDVLKILDDNIGSTRINSLARINFVKAKTLENILNKQSYVESSHVIVNVFWEKKDEVIAVSALIKTNEVIKQETKNMLEGFVSGAFPKEKSVRIFIGYDNE